MERHFIESYGDEREVLRKIEELKTAGFSENDMYVIARSSEQLTRIRTRTEVDYHTAEGKGMGRVGIFFKGGPLPPVFSEMADETRESAMFYQQLLEGKILFFYREKGGFYPSEQSVAESKTEWPSAEALRVGKSVFSKSYSKEDDISIDESHYDSFPTGQAVAVRNRSGRNQKKNNAKRDDSAF